MSDMSERVRRERATAGGEDGAEALRKAEKSFRWRNEVKRGREKVEGERQKIWKKCEDCDTNHLTPVCQVIPCSKSLHSVHTHLAVYEIFSH